MEQQEKQAIRSQRLRRAVTCMKRKDREGGEEEEGDGEEEMHSPSRSKRGKAASKSPKKDGRSVSGGFLGSEMIVESSSLEDVSSTSPESLPVKTALPSMKTVPQGVKRSSSSSGEDSDGGSEIAMVTARSVFEGSRRGRGTKSTRGKTRGQGRRKKL